MRPPGAGIESSGFVQECGDNEALHELAFTPCAGDAEFLEKLRYLYAQQAKIWDLPNNDNDYGCIAIAAACHFCPVNV